MNSRVQWTLHARLRVDPLEVHAWVRSLPHREMPVSGPRRHERGSQGRHEMWWADPALTSVIHHCGGKHSRYGLVPTLLDAATSFPVRHLSDITISVLLPPQLRWQGSGQRRERARLVSRNPNP